MKSKPRILVIENSTAVTGAMKSIVNTTSALSTSFEFQFIIPSGSSTRTRFGNAIVHQWRMTEISKRIIPLAIYLPRLIINGLRLKRFVRRNHFEIIHVNDLYNLIPVMAKLFGCDVPYVCHVRFMPERFPGALFRFWLNLHLRYACKVVVVSKALKKQLPDHEKIVVAHDGYPFIENSAIDTPNNHTFLYLSNIIPGKGQDHALRAFINIHKQLPEWKLKFVGSDMGLSKNKGYQLNLKKIAEIAGVGDRVEWNGFAEDVSSQYRTADIVLNFSESESFSKATLEALSCGRPIVVTDCGGPAEIVRDKVTGFLVPNKNTNAMEHAMIELATNPSLRKTMGEAAEADMRSRFDVKQTAKKLEEVYRSCMPSI